MLKKGEPKAAKAPKKAKAVKAPKPLNPRLQKLKDMQQSQIYEPKRIDPSIRGVLSWLHLGRPSPCTMILQARGHTKASPERVWEVFSDLAKWPTWTKPFITSAKWVHSDQWLSGAQFEQTVNYGPPMSGKPTKETIKEAVEAQQVAWMKDLKGMKTVHLWYFEPNTDGSTEIVVTEAMYGQQVFFLKWLWVRPKWNKFFQQMVKNLIKAAEKGPDRH